MNRKELIEKGFKTVGMIGKELNKAWLRPNELPQKLLVNGIKSNGIFYPPEVVDKIVEYINLPEREKTKLTDLERYGVEHHTRALSVKQKQEKTNLEKYGAKSSAQSKDVKEKQIQTLQKHFGVSVPAKNKEIASKISKTSIITQLNLKGSIEDRCNSLHDDFTICSDYLGEKKEIYIYCNNCGNLFKRIPLNLKRSCPYCTGVTSNTDWFIQRAKLIHNDYSYEKVEYIDNKTKVEIFCKRCKKYFWQRPNDHLNGCGHDCNTKSKREIEFEKLLIKNKIDYQKEVTFDDCRGKRNKLPFDFYIPSKDLLIEIQGEQHYKNKWGDLEERQRLDKIKRTYATLKHKFLEIPYWEDLDFYLNSL